MVSLAEGSLERETRCTNFEKRSTMVMTQVLPSDGDRLVTKSMEIWDQGWRGTHRGLGRLGDGWLSTLKHAQMLQDNQEPWDHSKTCKRKQEGTKKQFGLLGLLNLGINV